MHKNDSDLQTKNSENIADLPLADSERACDLPSPSSDTLAQRAKAIGMTPVQAFIFPASSMPTANLARLKNEKSPITSTDRHREKWAEKGFKQLGLIVPNSPQVRDGLYAIQDSLKKGATWPDALYADATVSLLKRDHDILCKEVESARSALRTAESELVYTKALLDEKTASGQNAEERKNLRRVGRYFSTMCSFLFSRISVRNRGSSSN